MQILDPGLGVPVLPRERGQHAASLASPAQWPSLSGHGSREEAGTSLFFSKTSASEAGRKRVSYPERLVPSASGKLPRGCGW